MKKTVKELVYGDLLWSELDGQYVRYSKTEPDSMIEVMDRNTLKPMPHLLHPTQVVPQC